MQIIKLISLLLGVVLADERTRSNLDTQIFGNASVPTAMPVASPKPVQTGKAKGGNFAKHIALDDKKSQTEAQQQSVDTINSLTLILRSTPAGVRRNTLLLNHATSLNLYVRQKTLTLKLTAPNEDLKKYLASALHDVEEVLKSPVKNDDQAWRAHDIAGISTLYLDQPEASKLHFLEVLKLNPPPEKAGRIGFMMAETYFDEEKFNIASDYYKKYFSMMTTQLKELALYKLGWCMVNLKQIDLAEDYLVKVAQVKLNSGVGKDALQDLAFLGTHQPKPIDEIKKIESKIVQPEDRLVFLYSVLVSLESQGSIELHTQIVNRLLKIETSAEKKLELSLASLRVQRNLYASERHMKAFMNVIDSLRNVKKTEFQAVFAKFQSPIENELQSIMKAYIDTYAKKVKSPEVFSQAKLGEEIKKQFMIYYQYYSQQPNFTGVVSIWRDVCLDLKDWICVDFVSRVILSRPTQLQDLFEKAYLDQIAALDQLLKLPNQANATMKEWKDRRGLRLKEFVPQFQKSSQWVQVAKIYARAELEQAHENIALPVFEQIMFRDASDESFYDLQFVRFKLKDYLGVLNDERGKKFISQGSKVIELYRESALNLAQRSKETANIDQYRSYLNLFVAYCLDVTKARIAKVDFFEFMIQKEKYEDAAKEFFDLPKEEFKTAGFEGLRVDLWKSSVENGLFEQSLRVAKLGESVNAKLDAWKQRKILSSLFLGKQPSEKDIDALSVTDREYFLGLASLVSSNFAIDYYRSKPSLNESERETLALAYKVKLDQWRLPRTAEFEKIFGKDYSFSDKHSTVFLPIEKKLAAITFPELAKMNPKNQAKTVQDNIAKIQALRAQVIPAIDGNTLDVQQRVLEMARDLEANMAKYLLSSPIPKELQEPQIAEYKAGIQGAADEFVQQSKQFELIAVKVREGVEKEAKKLEARILPVPEMSLWPWPAGSRKLPKLKWIHELSNANNSWGALALLDYLRKPNLSLEQDFFYLRTGILLSHQPSGALRIYLLEELKKNKQFVVLKSWTDMVKRSILEVE